MIPIIQNKKVLVAPLDWGLGHAARCIPIIESLLENNNEVIIAADGTIKKMLQNEFSNLKFASLFNYNIKYSNEGKYLWLAMLKQIPKIFSNIKKEKKWLNKFVVQEKIEVVIADNRYGLFTQKCKCIFITHQLTLQMPSGWKMLEKITKKIFEQYIEKFDECWIPDFANEQNNLSGLLSHHQRLLPNTIFIEPLSRFEKLKKNIHPIENDILILISGPEPQRTVLEKKIIAQLLAIENYSGRIIFIGGKFNEKVNKLNLPPFVKYYSALNSSQLCAHMLGAKKIICRSGYSTIMDLNALNKKAIFIPTPNQTEQEYLAKLMRQNNLGNFETQNNFELQRYL